ncbi:hypothetical protein FIA58_006615 [Flavobacterium jejuense]|uniref:Lipoprotein n=1 Tax=Flavobacterium jejuense TaxID=1544455 RepID=A0ABX0ITD8_9FLAO|nr:hypothetical protein [Flavobacterium jejuense]NHN25346.1 hypothetical protein [Flavobacterium jejuense]
MKKTYIFALIILASSCASTEMTIPDKLDPIHIANAKEFAFSQFQSCTTESYIPITTKIATPSFSRSLTIDVLKESCKEINESNGTLLKLEIQQTLVYKKTLIYRFKATYSKIEHHPEIRVYSTLANKYNGLILKPEYLEKYTPFKPETKI